MVSKLFAVFDAKVGAYLPPFCAAAPGQAARMFGDAVRDGQSAFSKHPEDYTLFMLGTFDDGTGDFVTTGRELVATGVSFVMEVPHA